MPRNDDDIDLVGLFGLSAAEAGALGLDAPAPAALSSDDASSSPEGLPAQAVQPPDAPSPHPTTGRSRPIHVREDNTRLDEELDLLAMLDGRGPAPAPTATLDAGHASPRDLAPAPAPAPAPAVELSSTVASLTPATDDTDRAALSSGEDSAPMLPRWQRATASGSAQPEVSGPGLEVSGSGLEEEDEALVSLFGLSGEEAASLGLPSQETPTLLADDTPALLADDAPALLVTEAPTPLVEMSVTPSLEQDIDVEGLFDLSNEEVWALGLTPPDRDTRADERRAGPVVLPGGNNHDDEEDTALPFNGETPLPTMRLQAIAPLPQPLPRGGDFHADPALLEAFAEESAELLDGLHVELEGLEGNPEDRDAFLETRRIIHTLKGGAKMCGFEHIGALTHACENLLDLVADGAAPLDTPALRALFACEPLLRATVQDALTGSGRAAGEEAERLTELAAHFDALCVGAGSTVQAPWRDDIDASLAVDTVPSISAAPWDNNEADGDEEDQGGAPSAPLDEPILVETRLEAETRLEERSALSEPAPQSAGDATTGSAGVLPADVGAQNPRSVTDTPEAGTRVDTPEARPGRQDVGAPGERRADVSEASASADTDTPDNGPAHAAPPLDDTPSTARPVTNQPEASAEADLSKAPSEAERPEAPSEAERPEAPSEADRSEASVGLVAGPQRAAAYAEPARPAGWVPAVVVAPKPERAAGRGDEPRPSGRRGSNSINVDLAKVDAVVAKVTEVAAHRASYQGMVRQLMDTAEEARRNVERLQALAAQIGNECARMRPEPTRSTPGAQSGARDDLDLESYSPLNTAVLQLQEAVSDQQALIQRVADTITTHWRLRAVESRVDADIQSALVNIRLIPLANMRVRLDGVVRQATQATGKNVRWTLQGGSVAVEKNVFDHLFEPLMHLLRNAVDHGLESAEGRRAAGKPETGSITVEARQEDNRIVIRVVDDGAGIDPDRVAALAVDRGVIAPDAARGLTPQQRMELIFTPGFSTAASVSHLSGRGVGMDAVREACARMGGTLELESKGEQGTTFALHLPLSLSVTRGLIVRDGGCSMALPVTGVSALHLVSADDIVEGPLGRVARIEGQDLPVYNLPPLPGARAADYVRNGEVHVLQVAHEGGFIGVLIEDVLGEEEMLVKAPPALLRHVKSLLGAYVLPDGTVAPVVNLPRVLADLRPVATLSPPAAEVGERPRTALIVDDSTSMRVALSGTLRNAGFTVLTARDGQEALDVLKHEGLPSLVTLDIEMPRMDGLEALFAIRQMPGAEALPVFMMTSRGGAKHRRAAEQLGATRYFTKPYRDSELAAAATAACATT